MFWWIKAQAGMTRTKLNSYRPLNYDIALGRVFGFPQWRCSITRYELGERVSFFRPGKVGLKYREEAMTRQRRKLHMGFGLLIVGSIWIALLWPPAVVRPLL